ncbi:MAG: hypothetical protein FD153_7 [Rhodospirillaceae bacterium]|nr:MAG: hypothetical protein FD153_7 [Rhodospirillaceae bacterium]
MGGEVRNLTPGLDHASQSTYTSESLSLLAAHLFEGYRIIDWAYAPVPYGVVWAVRDDGALLSLTYLPEHQVVAWCRHVTDGHFKAVAAIPEGNETAVYVVVHRLINNKAVQYIERFASRSFMALQEDPAQTPPRGRPALDRAVDIKRAFFVDCGLSYDGSPTQFVGNLTHLEGCEVVALADGNVVRGLTVKRGQVEFPRFYSVIHVGLPYTSEIETLPLSFGAQTTGGTAPSKPKRITGVTLEVQNTRGLWAGPDAEHLDEFKQRNTEAWREPVRPTTGVISLRLSGSWKPENTVLIQQRDPLPMTILAVTPEVSVSQ